MDNLWAPWRIRYISRIKKGKRCIFCSAKAKNAKRGPVFKTRHSVCMLNLFPYNNGHLMVSPLRHVSQPELLSDAESLDLFKTMTKAKRLLNKVLKPDGFNIGINIGRAAGAGIAGHLHIHIVPRWVGDSNFMPVIHNTKIISQSLEELSRRLRNAKPSAD